MARKPGLGLGLSWQSFNTCQLVASYAPSISTATRATRIVCPGGLSMTWRYHKSLCTLEDRRWQRCDKALVLAALRSLVRHIHIAQTLLLAIVCHGPSSRPFMLACARPVSMSKHVGRIAKAGTSGWTRLRPSSVESRRLEHGGPWRVRCRHSCLRRNGPPSLSQRH